MKLELKHLAPYLPYDLKVLDLHDNKERLLVGYNSNHTEQVKVSIYKNQLSTGRTPKEIKPILRPLEDLTRQNVLDMIEYSDFEYIYHNINPIDLIFINTEEKNYLSDILNQTEFLFKNHFDVFGLIEKGLAIDINTIK